MGLNTLYSVGETLPARKWVPTALQLRQYAEASGDYNPIHLDEQYAQKAGLGGIIAHGMLTMAQVGVMLTDWVQEQGTLGQFEVTFKKMVRPGDVILCTGRIQAILDQTLACEIRALTQEGVEVLSGSALVILNGKR